MSDSAKRRTKTVVAAAAALALLIGGSAIAVAATNGSARSPKAAATKYLEALKDGKVDTINAIADPQASSGERKTLSQQVYDKAEHRISDLRIINSDVNGTSARVKAEVTQDQKKSTIDMNLHRVENTALALHNWELDEPLTQVMTVRVPEEVTKITVNGVEIEPDFKADGSASDSDSSDSYSDSDSDS